MNDLREVLELWPLMSDEQRADVAQRMRPSIVAMLVERGARTPDEVRDLLEMFVAGARAELDAREPTAMPRLNRAARRAAVKR